MKKKKKFIIILLVIVLIVIICSIVFCKFVYGKKETFQGRIIEINGNMITVEAVETNDSRFVGKFVLEINDKTNIEVLGKQTDLNTINDLFQYPMVEINFSGKISETSPAKINHIIKIKLLAENDVFIVVYLNGDATTEEKETIKHKIQSIEGITSIEYKSREDYKNEMSNNSEKLKDILDSLEDNPLMDTYIVTINDRDKKEEIIHMIENLNKVYSVK